MVYYNVDFQTKTYVRNRKLFHIKKQIFGFGVDRTFVNPK